MVNYLDIINSLDFYEMFTELCAYGTNIITPSGLNLLLDNYGYLNNPLDFENIPANLRIGGMLDYIYTEPNYRNTLTQHPRLVIEGLKGHFENSRTGFLSILPTGMTYELLKSAQPRWEVVSGDEHVVHTWANPLGASRTVYAPLGGWNYTDYASQKIFGPDFPPEEVKLVTDTQPSGHKIIHMFGGFDSHSNNTEGNFGIPDGGNTALWVGFGDSGIQPVSLIDFFVTGVLENVSSGTFNLIEISGYPSIYFNSAEGWKEQTNRAAAWFKKYKDIGGEVDWLMVDYEGLEVSQYEVASQQYYLDGEIISAPDGKTVGNYIIEDTRWPALYAEWSGLIPHSSDVSTIHAWGPTSNRAQQWNEWQHRYLARQWNEKVFETIKQYFPNVKCYNYAELSLKAPNIQPVVHASWLGGSASGIGELIGTHKGTAAYLGVGFSNQQLFPLYIPWSGQDIGISNTGEKIYVNEYGAPVMSGQWGFDAFLGGIRELKNAKLVSNDPGVMWVVPNLLSHESPRTTIKPRGPGQVSINLGQYQYLHDEFLFHCLINGTQLVTWNAQTNRLTDYGYEPSGAVTRWTDVRGTVIPSSIPNCVLWLDASTNNEMFQDVAGTVPVTATGQPIGKWESKVGSTFAACTNSAYSGSWPLWYSGGFTPTFAQLPAVNCHSTGDALVINPVGLHGSGFTVLMAISLSGQDVGNHAVFGAQSGSVNLIEWQVSSTAVNSVKRDVNGFTSKSITNNLTAGVDKSFILGEIVVPFSGLETHPSLLAASGRLYPGFASIENGDISLGRYTYDDLLIGNTGVAYSDNIRTNKMTHPFPASWSLGSYFANGSALNQGRAINAQFGEILVYDRPLNDNEIRDVSAYLYAKWKPDSTGFYIYPTKEEYRNSLEEISLTIDEFEQAAIYNENHDHQHSDIKLILWDDDNTKYIKSSVDTYVAGKCQLHRITVNPRMVPYTTYYHNETGCSISISGEQLHFPNGVICSGNIPGSQITSNGFQIGSSQISYESPYTAKPPSGFWIREYYQYPDTIAESLDVGKAPSDAYEFVQLQALANIYNTETLNYYIGSGIGDDYPTLKKWWYDFVTQGSGDLVSWNKQVNVYLRGGQAHPVETGTPIPGINTTYSGISDTDTDAYIIVSGDIEYHYFYMNSNSGVYTDSERYFKITAESGYEFYGTFDNPNIPYITPSSEISFSPKGGIFCDVPYTQMYGFIVKDVELNFDAWTLDFKTTYPYFGSESASYASGRIFGPESPIKNTSFGIITTAPSSIIDRVGIQNIRTSSNFATGVYGSVGLWLGEQTEARNCVVNNIYCSGGSSQQTNFGLVGGIRSNTNSNTFNNTVGNISGYFEGVGFIGGIGISYSGFSILDESNVDQEIISDISNAGGFSSINPSYSDPFDGPYLGIIDYDIDYTLIDNLTLYPHLRFNAIPYKYGIAMPYDGAMYSGGCTFFDNVGVYYLTDHSDYLDVVTETAIDLSQSISRWDSRIVAPATALLFDKDGNLIYSTSPVYSAYSNIIEPDGEFAYANTRTMYFNDANTSPIISGIEWGPYGYSPVLLNGLSSVTKEYLSVNPLLQDYKNGYTASVVFEAANPTTSSGTLIATELFSTTSFGNNWRCKLMNMGIRQSQHSDSGMLFGMVRVSSGQPIIDVYTDIMVRYGERYIGILTADPYDSVGGGRNLYLECYSSGVLYKPYLIGSTSTSLIGTMDYWSFVFENTELASKADHPSLRRLNLGGTDGVGGSAPTDVEVRTRYADFLYYDKPVPLFNDGTIDTGVMLGNIPAGYGNTREGIAAHLFRLWFEHPDQTPTGCVVPTNICDALVDISTPPSHGTIVNNYALNTVDGLCIATGSGPEPLNNAVQDYSLVPINNNLVNIQPSNTIYSNDINNFNPKLKINSPIIDNGYNLSDSGFNYDVAGETRSVWDIGADEQVFYNVSGNPNLYTAGSLGDNNNIELFIHGYEPDSDFVNLSISGEYRIISPLFIHGYEPYDTGLNMSIDGTSLVSGIIPLYLRGPAVPYSGSMNLHIKGTAPTGQIPLYINAISGRPSNGLNLVIPGYEPAMPDPGISGMNLFIQGTAPTGFVDLHIHGYNLQNNLNLFMSGYGGISINAIDLFVGGLYESNSGIPLSVDGQADYRKLNLFIHAEPPVKASIPLFVGGDVARNLNLYVAAPNNDDHDGEFNLYVAGGGINQASIVPLYLHNSQSGTPGWGATQQGMALFMARDGVGQMYTIPMTIHGGLDNEAFTNMFIGGGIGSTGSIDLFIRGLPTHTGTLRMYTRGF